MPDKRSGLIWIQTFDIDGIPGRIFEKSYFFRYISRPQMSMQNYPAYKVNCHQDELNGFTQKLHKLHHEEVDTN